MSNNKAKTTKRAALAAKLAEQKAAEQQVKHDLARDKDQQRLRALQAKCRVLESELAIAEQRVEFVSALGEPTEPNAMHAKPIKGARSPATPVLVLTDWHAEETVLASTTDGLNEYNLDICAARVRRTVSKFLLLLALSRSAAKIDHMVLAILGDMITGYIHAELVESNELSPTEASLFVQDLIHETIQVLLKEADVKRIVIPCCFGNHGRTTEKMRISTAYKNSYEWLLYHSMARFYKGEARVEWRITNGYHNWIEIQGRKVRFHHGDGIKYQGGTGGIAVPANLRIMRSNMGREPAYLDVFGHWHQFQYSEPGGWIAAPCLIGYTPYGIYKNLSYSEPGQLYLMLDRDRGLTEVKKIFCKEDA